MKTFPPPVLCTVLASADESVALLGDIEALGYPIAGALHLSHGASSEAVARLDAAGLVTIAVRPDATVRSPTGGARGTHVSDGEGGVHGVRDRLGPLAALERHNPETWWSLVNDRIGAGRMVLLLPLVGPAALERAALERCLARGVDRVQLLDIGPA